MPGHLAVEDFPWLQNLLVFLGFLPLPWAWFERRPDWLLPLRDAPLVFTFSMSLLYPLLYLSVHDAVAVGMVLYRGSHLAGFVTLYYLCRVYRSPQRSIRDLQLLTQLSKDPSAALADAQAYIRSVLSRAWWVVAAGMLLIWLLPLVSAAISDRLISTKFHQHTSFILLGTSYSFYIFLVSVMLLVLSSVVGSHSALRCACVCRPLLLGSTPSAAACLGSQ